MFTHLWYMVYLYSCNHMIYLSTGNHMVYLYNCNIWYIYTIVIIWYIYPLVIIWYIDCSCSHMIYHIEFSSDDVLYPFIFIRHISQYWSHSRLLSLIFIWCFLINFSQMMCLDNCYCMISLGSCNHMKYSM